MNEYCFFCLGHPNILGKHAKTLEFTKDDFVTLQGDCIIGIKADFQLLKLKKFLADKEKLNANISCDGIKDNVEFTVNKEFNDANEIVIRKSEFNSKRTLGFRSDKGAIDLKRELIEKIKQKDMKIEVVFKGIA